MQWSEKPRPLLAPLCLLKDLLFAEEIIHLNPRRNRADLISKIG